MVYGSRSVVNKYTPKMHRFEIFAFEKYTVTLKSGLESFEVIENRFDR